jgi:hypothetical protein
MASLAAATSATFLKAAAATTAATLLTIVVDPPPPDPPGTVDAVTLATGCSVAAFFGAYCPGSGSPSIVHPLQ